MSDPAFWHRLQFAFTISYHYLFPQLTMGLAWFLVYWKWQALRTGDERYNRAVRFWARIFGLNFAVGVVTGIPMEFQFGTNWAGFTKYAGGVIGHLARTDDISFPNLKEAIIQGTLVASFCVEEFSLRRLQKLAEHEIAERRKAFGGYIA